jgi:hypothetical protein
VLKGVIFDLFHTLTAVESGWSDLPWTSDVLGLARADWDAALTLHSRWRLAGEVRDPRLIVAGFDAMEIRAEHVHFSQQDFRVAWESNLRSAGHRDVRSLAPESLEQLRVTYERRLAESWASDPEGFSRAEVLFAVATAS